MSIKHLIIFVRVYKEESITIAANKLGIAQPAVSLAIKELEAYYSVKLFEKAGRGIRKTEASHHFYEYALHITSLYSEMDNEFKNFNSNERLRIGGSISVGTCFMPNYIKSFIRKYNTQMPYVKIDSSDIIEQMILDNRLDIAITEGNIHSDKILSEPLIKDNLILVCSRFNTLATMAVVTLDDIKDENFLLRERNSGTRELVDGALLLHDFIINPLWESSSTNSLINAVISDIGISILPERMLTSQLQKRQLIKVNLQGVEFNRQYNIIYHQNKFITPTLNNFINFIKENMI